MMTNASHLSVIDRIAFFGRRSILAAALVLSTSFNVMAAQKEIGSCYDALKLPDGVNRPELERELYVVIDQTVQFDKGLQEQAFQKIMKFLKPGDRLVIVSFSAYVADRYTDVVFDGVIDARLSDEQRYDISKKVLRVLDQCYQVQEVGVRQEAGKALVNIFGSASSDLPNTELIGNLSLLGKDVMRTGSTDHQYVLLVSDMLEHSAITTFYSRGKLRKIKPESEVDKVVKADIISDFSGAGVYVMGAGFSLKGAYRAATEMKAIEAFWRSYFEHSNAKLIEFGSPALIGEIGR